MAKRILLALLLSLVAVSPTICSEDERKSLAGITGMNVIVEIIQGDLLEAGLSKEQLKTDVELKLRHAGIKVDSQFSPFVYVRIDCSLPKSASGQDMGYIAVAKIQFKQGVYIPGKFDLMYAPTWESSITIWGPKSNYQDDARKRVGDLIDQFINDYLAVNPKE